GQIAASTLISHDLIHREPNRKQQKSSILQTEARPPRTGVESISADLMEAAAATSSSLVLFSSSPRKWRSSVTSLPSPSLLRPPCNSCSVYSGKQQRLICLAVPWLNSKTKSSTLRCSSSLADGPSTVGSSVKWILDPAGDGDWRHIGYKVARPGAVEIASDTVTVGRVADKADIVLPLPQFLARTHGWRRRTGGCW
ncbi:unnamed protein product, partial [Urochloa humidicola]